jgi:hypothetical protein
VNAASIHGWSPTTGGGAPSVSAAAAQGLDDRCRGVDLERRAHEDEPQLGLQPRVRGGDEREQLGELALDVAGALAGERAPLHRQDAAPGIARQLLPAGDERRVDARRAEQRMRAALQARLQPAQAGQHGRHAGDRVDAEIRARAVGGAAARLELGPDEALVGDAGAQRRRLGDDAGVGAPARRTDCMPALACSSSATAVTTTSPRRPAPAAAAPASMIAASPPFMS